MLSTGAWVSPIASADTQAPRYRESYPFGMASCRRGKPMAIQMMALRGGAEIHSVYSERPRHVICFKDFAVML